jgi:hypothetical protein
VCALAPRARCGASARILPRIYQLLFVGAGRPQRPAQAARRHAALISGHVVGLAPARLTREAQAARWACGLLFVDARSRIDRTMAPDFVLAIRHAALGAPRRPHGAAFV